MVYMHSICPSKVTEGNTEVTIFIINFILSLLIVAAQGIFTVILDRGNYSLNSNYLNCTN